MRNNFLICTLLAGLTQSIQLSGEAHQQEHAAEHEADLQAHHDAEKAAEAEAQPPNEKLIELKRERFEDLDFLQIDTATTTSTGTCGAWHDRVKNGQNIFYGVQSGSAEFVDPTFPHDTAIRDDGNPSFVNGGGLQSASQSAEWVHSIDSRFGEEDYSLFGSTGISPHDIGQGSIGNCWLMHGMAAVAEKPGRI